MTWNHKVKVADCTFIQAARRQQRSAARPGRSSQHNGTSKRGPPQTARPVGIPIGEQLTWKSGKMVFGQKKVDPFLSFLCGRESSILSSYPSNTKFYRTATIIFEREFRSTTHFLYPGVLHFCWAKQQIPHNVEKYSSGQQSWNIHQVSKWKIDAGNDFNGDVPQ